LDIKNPYTDCFVCTGDTKHKGAETKPLSYVATDIQNSFLLKKGAKTPWSKLQ